MKYLPWILLALVGAVLGWVFLRPAASSSASTATGVTGKPAGDTAGGILSGVGDLLGGLGAIIGSFSSSSSSSSSGSSTTGTSASGGDPNAGDFGNPNYGGEA